MTINPRPGRWLGVLLCASLASEVLAQDPVVKVDLDFAGRQTSEVNEPGYTPWSIGSVSTASETFDGVSVTFTQSGGVGLRSNWFKTHIQSPYLARLVSDGLLVDFGDGEPQEGAITMTLSDLPAGEHSLLVYLNSVDGWADTTVAPLDIFVDGVQIENDLAMTNRVEENTAAQTAYLTFDSTGDDVEVRFEADTGAGAEIETVVINGFELNTPNVAQQARQPLPADGDRHVETTDGHLTLNWTPGPDAVAHEVYFGTDEALVSDGDSSVYWGRQASGGFALQGLYSREEYLWRVDQVDQEDRITRGNVWSFQPRQLAFPDAEGYGRFALGGRGGQVVKVTNLNDSGPGSLRAAVENDIGPRTIVFDVSGIIHLESRLTVSDSYVTVAGQTAPGKGIVVRGAPFGVSGASDVVMRHVRVRLGAGTTYDGIGLQGADHAIVDHSSISWTIDEAFSSRSARNITLQRTLIAEALNVAGHDNYPSGTRHGYAASISGDIGSFHHNLLAHNEGRNWSLAGGLDGNGDYAGRLDIFNNVVYNWRSRTTDGGAHEVNFVNNYYKPGPATEEMYALNVEYDNFPGTQRYYCSGNVIPGRADESNQTAVCRVKSGSPNGYETWVNEPFFPSRAEVHSAAEAYKRVLSDVGAGGLMQDDQDLRVIQETLTGTATYEGSYTGEPGLPDHEDDVGGYEDYPYLQRDPDWDSDDDGLPDWWEKLHGLNPLSGGDDFADANADPDRDGYTMLDEYLDWMAQPHTMIREGEAAELNLSDLFRGYTDEPAYSIISVSNGSVALENGTAVFTTEACGLAEIALSVEDADGHSMTRTVHVFVDTDPAGECERSPEYDDAHTPAGPADGQSDEQPAPDGGDDGVDMSNDTTSGGGGSVSLTGLVMLSLLVWRRRQRVRPRLA
ncbi:polysaccharide lyase family 1 protein [Marinimicrobium sp. LS-A18]|uniref:pectate lyase family protein n=1 Tax=Marinimicrobium sp. LS-A18 TaxID=1381596 RepID=UPI0004646091|nr:GlyGly-CTERM sorting domain-containing protein [Marinimicrobium sp. LS-A18]